jgi:PKD repeat protein
LLLYRDIKVVPPAGIRQVLLALVERHRVQSDSACEKEEIGLTYFHTKMNSAAMGRREVKSAARRIRRCFLLAAVLAASSFSDPLRAQVANPPVVEEGTLEVFISDDFGSGASQTVYRLRADSGESLELNPPPGADVPTRTGTRVRVTGHREGDLFAADRVEVLSSPAEDQAAQLAAASGTKRVLVMLVNFQNDTSQPYTPAQAQNTVFGASGSVAAYYTEVSYGITGLTGGVAGWYTLPMNKPTTCDIGQITSLANSAATAGGFPPSNYDFPVYVFPSIPCGWAGLGSVGGGGAWINQALSVYVTAHELGHNYGVLHAHSWDCGTVAIGPTCSRSEYGDPFDVMGGNLRHMNAYFKNSLGWLTGSSVAAQSLGTMTYTMSPLESSSGTRAVKLTTVAGRTYWLEFRQGIGFDGGLSSNANVMNGVLVHLGPSAAGGADLLDMTPATDTFGDAALTVANTFTDAAASMAVTVLSKTGSTLSVEVRFGITPPTTSFTFSPASPRAGQAIAFTDTTTGLPSAWSWDFGDGITSSTQSPTHAYALAGTYTVQLTASNGSGSTSATHTVTVSPALATSFFTLTPCRAIDTRNAFGTYGGPFLFANNVRSFTLTGRCGIPATAKAIATNVTVTTGTAAGFLTLYPGGSVVPSVSAINYRVGQTRANNVLVGLGSSGDLLVRCFQSSGTVHFILDVTGYFE